MTLGLYARSPALRRGKRRGGVWGGGSCRPCTALPPAGPSAAAEVAPPAPGAARHCELGVASGPAREHGTASPPPPGPAASRRDGSCSRGIGGRRRLGDGGRPAGKRGESRHWGRGVFARSPSGWSGLDGSPRCWAAGMARTGTLSRGSGRASDGFHSCA